MDKENKVRETVKQKFTEYLTANKCRKTPERYAILDLIYTEQRHFDMDTLYQAMKEKNFRVSRATLYNTMQLLLDSQLVLKHQFGNTLSVYERAYNNDFHHHLICTECHKVREYKDSGLKLAIRNKKIKQFTPVHYSLYIYGLCNICTRKLKKEYKLAKTQYK
ncbi:MAG: transcriptional repressor [Dysgonamonadaceae bacterium]|jgi:Fur family ferric uptake transcriptional regulator|nr:transcriptional repressor [Dysgonamonadaceae bacterium]